MAENAGLDAELDKAVPTENTTAFLLAVNGSQPGRVYPVNRNTMILGRSDSADIRIAHPSVSSEHARIINGSLGFEIEDLGSTNGTYLGSERVTRARLQSGDRIVLGTVEFSFLVDRAQDATVALLPPGAAACRPTTCWPRSSSGRPTSTRTSTARRRQPPMPAPRSRPSRPRRWRRSPAR